MDPAVAALSLADAASTTWIIPASDDGQDSDGFPPDDSQDPSEISLADLAIGRRGGGGRESINTPPPYLIDDDDPRQDQQHLPQIDDDNDDQDQQQFPQIDDNYIESCPAPLNTALPSSASPSSPSRFEDLWQQTFCPDQGGSMSPTQMKGVNPMEVEGRRWPEEGQEGEVKTERMEEEQEEGTFDLVNFVTDDARPLNYLPFRNLLGGSQDVAYGHVTTAAAAASSTEMAAPTGLSHVGFFSSQFNRQRPNAVATVTSATAVVAAASSVNSTLVVVSALDPEGGAGGGQGRPFMTLDVAPIWQQQEQQSMQQSLPAATGEQRLPSFGKRRTTKSSGGGGPVFANRRLDRRQALLDHPYQTAPATSSSSPSAASLVLSPSVADATVSAENARHRSRELNNIASRRCRENRRAREEAERTEMARLQSENERLNRIVTKLLDRIRTLKGILNELQEKRDVGN